MSNLIEGIKSKDKLESFVGYCIAHPEERFWQALRNWSEYNFIYGSKHLLKEGLVGVKDTFYIE